jgi:hypothetical protein
MPEVPEAIRRLLNGDHELWKQHVLEAYNIGLRENAALLEQLAEALRKTWDSENVKAALVVYEEYVAAQEKEKP